MRISNIILILLFYLLLTSCDRNRIFEKNQNIDDRLWHKDSTISFLFPVEDIYHHYDIYVNIRNTNQYPYQNLYINYVLEDTLGNKIISDLSDLLLFDSKTGRPLGNGMGDIFDHQFIILEKVKFKNPGYYRININQYMRLDILPEIMAVGIRVEIQNTNNE